MAPPIRRKFFHNLILVLGIVGFALCTACAPVPLDAPKPVTRAATAPPSAQLKQAAGLFAAGRDVTHSSIIPLVEGNEALGARLRIIEQAEHALDLQYFLMKPDLATALIARALLDAADRGVRVRLLLDDVFTTATDRDLALLDAHPQIDVRIFNPAVRPGPKMASFAVDFPRMNRRMHNKMFLADGAVAIVGGRNIADEYFQLQTDSEFADFEIVLMGPVIEGLEDAYDLYWNDGWSVPLEALADLPTQADFSAERAELEAALVNARRVYDTAVNNPLFDRLRSGQEPIYQARADVVVDMPRKVKQPVREGPRIVAEDLLMRMQNATHEVLLMTPYFVPEDYGARLFQNLAQRGVKVRIVTNSLGSTNHAYVHAGYRRHRAALIESGVELHEIRPDALQAMGAIPPGDASGLVMHTKLAVIDRDEVFVGSLNLDPRSVKLNTEVGVLIDSHGFGGFMHQEVERELRNFTYRLSLNERGDLRWHYDHPNARSVTTQEPGATLWNQTLIGLTELLGVELQL